MTCEETEQQRILPETTIEADAQWWAAYDAQNARRRAQEPVSGPPVRQGVSTLQWVTLSLLGALNVFLWTFVLTVELW